MAVGILPKGVAFWHPACLVATWFGAGLLPRMPGTWGSLAALPFAWIIHSQGGPLLLAIASAAIFMIGWWAASYYVVRSHEADPGAIVVDEVAAQWLVLAVAPLNPWYYLLAFMMFRAADVLKPWPASWADRTLKGGFGVMADDILAAPYAMIVVFGLAELLR